MYKLYLNVLMFMGFLFFKLFLDFLVACYAILGNNPQKSAVRDLFFVVDLQKETRREVTTASKEGKLRKKEMAA